MIVLGPKIRAIRGPPVYHFESKFRLVSLLRLLGALDSLPVGSDP